MTVIPMSSQGSLFGEEVYLQELTPSVLVYHRGGCAGGERTSWLGASIKGAQPCSTCFGEESGQSPTKSHTGP